MSRLQETMAFLKDGTSKQNLSKCHHQQSNIVQFLHCGYLHKKLRSDVKDTNYLVLSKTLEEKEDALKPITYFNFLVFILTLICIPKWNSYKCPRTLTLGQDHKTVSLGSYEWGSF